MVHIYHIYRRHPFVPKSPNPPNHPQPPGLLHHTHTIRLHSYAAFHLLTRSLTLSHSLSLSVSLVATIHKRRQTQNAHARFPLFGVRARVSTKQTQNYAFHFAPRARLRVMSAFVCVCVCLCLCMARALYACARELRSRMRGAYARLVVVVYGKLYVLVHALARNIRRAPHDTTHTETYGHPDTA